MAPKFSAYVNPLAFLEVDEPWAFAHQRELTFEDLVRFLGRPDEHPDLNTLVARYREISTEPRRLNIVPAEAKLLTKIVWPLRQAKAAYMLGNYIGTIALCGFALEMLAVLIWDCAEMRIGTRPLNSKDESLLFGRSFERLGQERRVNVLFGYGQIDADIRDLFDTVREVRRKHLHLWSQDHADIAGDAVRCFHASVTAVVAAVGQEIDEGRIALHPRIIRYLERVGMVRPDGPGDAGEL